MRALAFLLCLLSAQAWAEELWVCGTGAGAADGTSLANCWNNAVTFGTGAGQFGRGDTLHVCGTAADPVDATITVASVGAFDGTVNADTDIVEIDGLASKCGGTQGVIANITGNGIIASGIAALKVHDLTIQDVTASGVSQLFSASSSCAIGQAYPCGCSNIYNITGYRVGTASGSTINVGASGNTTFPATAVPGICGINNTGYDSGGSTYRKRLNTTGAVIRGNVDYRGGGVTNTWPIYAAGVTLNCGVANSGAGVTWTQVSGTVYRTLQTSCGATSGASIIGVDVGSPAAGVTQILTLDGACTSDGTCGTLTAGSYGINTGTNTVWINKGSQPLATAAVDLIYARASYTKMQDNQAYQPDDAFDGVGMGIDFGEDYGTISGGYVEDAPTYGFAMGRGNTGTTIRSSISNRAGTAAVNAVGTGSVENVSSAGSATLVRALVYTGETLTVKNSGGADISTLVSDTVGKGTITQTANSSATPGFIGGTAPATAAGFCLDDDSALIGAGTYIGAYVEDYYGHDLGKPPNIGALGPCMGRHAAQTRPAAAGRTQ